MMSTLSPGPEDSGRLRIENNQLKLQVKQLTVDLQSEQGLPNCLQVVFSLIHDQHMRKLTFVAVQFSLACKHEYPINHTHKPSIFNLTD